MTTAEFWIDGDHYVLRGRDALEEMWDRLTPETTRAEKYQVIRDLGERVETGSE